MSTAKFGAYPQFGGRLNLGGYPRFGGRSPGPSVEPKLIASFQSTGSTILMSAAWFSATCYMRQ